MFFCAQYRVMHIQDLTFHDRRFTWTNIWFLLLQKLYSKYYNQLYSISHTRFHFISLYRYYRFNSARKLTQLLLFDKGGCSNHHPGVGDVHFIKDLRNKRIVTTQFQCSRFGAHFHKSLGWVSTYTTQYDIGYEDVRMASYMLMFNYTYFSGKDEWMSWISL